MSASEQHMNHILNLFSVTVSFKVLDDLIFILYDDKLSIRAKNIQNYKKIAFAFTKYSSSMFSE